jgi:ABC-type branched-subunit amino acid transport system substrate-binding protein
MTERSTFSRRETLVHLAATAAALGGATAPTRAAGKAIRIGSTLAQTGIELANGTGLTLGATAFFTALNKAGGVNGNKVELVLADDQFDPEKAKQNALAFAADPSIVGILHPLGTRQTAAVMDNAPNVPVVGPNTGTVALRKKDARNVFWVRANYDQEIEKLINTASTLGTSRIALVHPKDPLGLSLLAGFEAAMARHNLKPVVIATTPNTTSTEVEPAAAEIAKAAPQLVIMGLGATMPHFVKAARKAGVTSTMYGLSIAPNIQNIRALGDMTRGLGFSIVVPTPFTPKHEIVRRYRADMEAMGSSDLSLVSLEGYINARVLTEGLRRAGANPTRESLHAGLEGLGTLDLGGLRLSFGKGDHEGSNFVDLAVIGPDSKLMT